jgi:sterol 3beta-glucosyltransferase
MAMGDSPSEDQSLGQFSRTSTLSSDSDSDALETASITSIYINAKKYEDVFYGAGCIQSRSSEDVAANAFHDLVGKDLDSSQQAIVSRIAKLTVAGDTWLPGDLTAEPDSDVVEDTDESSSGSSVDDSLAFESKSPGHRAETSDMDGWKLEPDEILDLLIQEFGPLAEEGEEEKLILETDGSLIHDVAMVVHKSLPVTSQILLTVLLGSYSPYYSSTFIPRFHAIN